MREIKFRGKNKKGQWEYGYLVREQFTAYDQYHNLELLSVEWFEYETVKSLSTEIGITYGYKIHRSGGQSSVWVDPKTIGQFIGLKD
ncbi:MAG: hypothetical protein WC389_21785, partial [Lutibacter sp.]